MINSKKFRLILVFSAISIFSCEQEEVTTSAQEKEVSEISILERQLGVTFFKQELVLRDESNQNTVTMVFASLNQKLLTEYLRTTEYKIKPILKSELIKASNQTTPSDLTIVGDDNEEIGYESKIVTEVTKISLAEGVDGFTTLIKNNKSNIYNGRTKARVWVEHTSSTWPEGLVVANGSSSDYVYWKLYKKNRNIDCCWGQYYYQYTQYEAQSYTNIDGPYRVKIKLEYNDSWGYGISWIQ